MSAVTGIRVDVDGTTSSFEADREERFLQALHTATGGDLVEAVRIGAEVEMWVDEEGLISGKQDQNPVGSALYMLLGGQTPIMGPVVFLGATDDEGWSTSLTDEAAAMLRDLAAADDPYRYLLAHMG